MSPIRIVMTLRHDLLYPRDGRVYKEAKSLVENGYEVTVVCWSKPDDNFPLIEELENIKIVRVKHNIPPPNASRIRKTPEYIKHIWNMVAKIRELKPDVIHCHDADTLLEGCLAKMSMKAILIYDSHENYPVRFRKTLPFLYIGTTILENIFMGYVDHVITVTETIADKFRKYGKSVTVIYNARPLEDVQPISKNSVFELRQKLGLDKNSAIVSLIGAISPNAGQHKLVEALKYVSNNSVKVLIVGGPKQQMDWLRSIVKEHKMEKRTILIDHVPYSEVMKYYKLTEIGCVLYQPGPNNEETAPNKLFEFMAAGIPIIASYFPEYTKILNTDGQSAIIVDPTDPKMIAREIDKLIANPNQRNKMSENVTKIVREKYNWGVQEQRLLKAYNTLLL
jgi:glycosyltransferase involved in cell wall biosynthesis